MIHDHDRSYYIGASDTKYVMGNWNTKTFRHWWDVKMGFDDDDTDNIYLRTGTLYEPKILDFIGITERDRQIIIGRLRVNLDGEDEDIVVEIKTVKQGTIKYYADGTLKIPKQYEQQLQVEMFASRANCGFIYMYEVNEDDYEAVENETTMDIDENRLHGRRYNPDDKWIGEEYLPRLWYLCDCLEKEKLPCMEDLHLT